MDPSCGRGLAHLAVRRCPGPARGLGLGLGLGRLLHGSTLQMIIALLNCNWNVARLLLSKDNFSQYNIRIYQTTCVLPVKSHSVKGDIKFYKRTYLVLPSSSPAFLSTNLVYLPPQHHNVIVIHAWALHNIIKHYTMSYGNSAYTPYF